MAGNGTNQNRKGGRPRVDGCRLVRELREAGRSWRTIGRVLGIGTATAMRLYNGVSHGRDASQNPDPVLPEGKWLGS